jgi:phosphate transport system permease protein
VLGVLTRGSAIGVIALLVALVAVLSYSAAPSLRAFGPSFLVTSEWRPNEIERPKLGPTGKVVIEDGETVMETVPPAFGALPVVFGTTVSSLLALVFAVPLSLGAALVIVRIAPRLRIAGVLSFLVEFLAAIPSIAYGIWGLFVLAPFLRDWLEPGAKAALGPVPGLGWMFTETVRVGGTVVERPIPLTGKDLFAGGLILGIMILPIVTAVSRDVLRAVPRAQVEASMALGATWWQSSRMMLRHAKAGLFGAVMLGLARAAGETMAITMLIGNNNQIRPSPFAPAQTMSSLLANEFAEATGDLHRAALLEVALILLVMSLLFNVAARSLVVGQSGRGGAK